MIKDWISGEIEQIEYNARFDRKAWETYCKQLDILEEQEEGYLKL
jgi:hypothetical protein